MSYPNLCNRKSWAPRNHIEFLKIIATKTLITGFDEWSSLFDLSRSETNGSSKVYDIKESFKSVERSCIWKKSCLRSRPFSGNDSVKVKHLILIEKVLFFYSKLTFCTVKLSLYKLSPKLFFFLWVWCFFLDSGTNCWKCLDNCSLLFLVLLILLQFINNVHEPSF